MSPLLISPSLRLTRVYEHLKLRLKGLWGRFYGLARKQPLGSTASAQKAVEIPMRSVQWPLDNSYSERPMYQNTVVYVNLDGDEKAIHKKERLPKITHYPPTHRLH
jgi:hypothetical protein